MYTFIARIHCNVWKSSELLFKKCFQTLNTSKTFSNIRCLHSFNLIRSHEKWGPTKIATPPPLEQERE